MPTISREAYDIQYRSSPVDEVAMTISFFDGDVRATIRTLIAERNQLRKQLKIAGLPGGETPKRTSKGE